jgi:hypothetical protein
MPLTAQFAGEFDSAILHAVPIIGRVCIDSASASRIVAIVRLEPLPGGAGA